MACSTACRSSPVIRRAQRWNILSRPQRELSDFDHASIAHDHGPLEHVSQLADIAGPPVTAQCLHRLRRQFHGRPGELAKKARRERQNVVTPLPQRLDANVEDIQPVIQIRAEFSAGHRFIKIAIGRSDGGDVDSDRPCATQPPELAVLQHTQKFRLRGRRHLGNFVEEQHASRRQFDLAGF